MKKEYDHVKFHMTLMNTRYRGENQLLSEEKSTFQKRQPFDGREIIEVCNNIII